MGQQFSSRYPHGSGDAAIGILTILTCFIWLPLKYIINIAVIIRKLNVYLTIMLASFSIISAVYLCRCYGYPTFTRYYLGLLC